MGVAALDEDLGGGTVALAVGVDDLVVDLDNGVEDLDGTVGLVALLVGLIILPEGLVPGTSDLAVETVGLLEGKVALEIGVEDLEGLVAVLNVERPVGVAGRDPGSPDDDSLLVPALDEFRQGDRIGCLDTKLFVAVGSGWGLANYKHNEVKI